MHVRNQDDSPPGDIGQLRAKIENLRRENGMLREMADRWRAMVESEPECVKVVAGDGTVLEMNPAGLAMLEAASLAEVKSRPLVDFVAPEDREAFTQLHQRVMRGERCTLQFSVIGLHGGQRWLETHAVPQADERGHPVALLAVTRDLTPRRAAETALSTAEARLRLALRAGEIGTWDWDLVTGRVVWSEEHERIWGLRPGSFGGTFEDFISRVHPDDRARLNFAVRDAIALGQTCALEFRVARGDGSQRWVAGQGEVFYGLDRKPKRMTGVVLDITERRLATEALRASEEKFATAFRASPVPFGIMRVSDSRLIEVNPAFEAMTGFTAEELIGRTLLELRIVRDTDVREERLGVIRRTGGLTARELEFFRKDGERLTVLAAGEVVEIGGEACLIGTAQDITDRRRAMEALRETDLRFRLLAENVREVFWIIEPNGRVLYVSPAFDLIWARLGQRVDRTPESWLATVYPDDRERIGRALAGRQPTGEFQEEYRIVRPNGDIRWVRERSFPVRDEAGKIYRVVGVSEDVTEGKELEERLLHAQRREAIGTLATGVAHDINNILAPILMGAALLQAHVSTEAGRHITEMIERNAQRGGDLVRRLLTLSRGTPTDRRQLRPAELIQEILTVIRATFPPRIQLQTDLAADLWDVEADATQLHQVLLNLCVNARDAMPGSGTLTVSAANALVVESTADVPAGLKPGRHVCIAVMDTGCGISEDVRAHIFEPFFTTKPPGEGTGLGLSTVAGIVRSHGGAVAVETAAGRGATFRVFLPALASAGEDAAREAPAALPGRNELVLVVDDEPAVRAAICAVLQHAGYRTAAASDGEEAMRTFLLRRGEFAVVVSDLVMPVMDGVALIGALRGLEPVLPIIVVAGNLDPAVERQLRELGVNEFLSKPSGAQAVLGAIHRQLAAR